MFNRITKKTISVICCLCLLFTVCYAGAAYTATADAATDKTIDTEIGRLFKRITLDDIGVKSTNKTTNETDFYLSDTDKDNAEKLDKLLFSSYVKFNNTMGTDIGTMLHLITKSESKAGITLTVSKRTDKFLTLKGSSGVTLYPQNSVAIRAEDLGIDGGDFKGKLILLQLSFEIADGDGDKTKDDLKIGVFINGKLANNSYIYALNATLSTTDIGTRMFFRGQAGEIYAVNDAVPATDVIDDTFTYYSIGGKMENGTTDGKSMTLDSASVNNVTFAMATVLKRARGKSTAIKYATKDDGSDGITIKLGDAKGTYLTVETPYGTENIYGTISPIADGIFLNKLFKLQLSTRLVDHDNDGAADDLELGVYINGYLYNGHFFYYDDADMTKLGNKISFADAAGEIYHLAKAITLAQSESADYTMLTLGNFGITSGTIGSSTVAGKYNGTLNQTVTGFTVKFDKNGSKVNFAVKDGQTNGGVSIKLNGKNLEVSAGSESGITMDTVTVEPFFASLDTDTFLGTEFTLHLSWLDQDGGNAKLGVFINGVLYNGAYITVPSVSGKVGSNMNFVGDSGKITYTGMPIPSGSVPAGKLTEITLLDAGIQDATGNAAGQFTAFTNLNNTIFGAEVSFKNEGATMHYGVNNNVNNADLGIAFKLVGKNILITNEAGNADGALTGLADYYIDPIVAGIGDTFVDAKFTLQISTVFEGQDIKLGVYINGALYCNQFITISGNADRFGTKINFTDGADTTFASLVKVYEEIDFDGFGVDYGKFTANTYFDDAKLAYLDYVAVTGTINLSKGSSILFGGKDTGLSLKALDNGNLSLDYIKLDKSVIKGTEIALADLVEKDVNIRMQISVAGGGQMIIKLYINGKRYGTSDIVIEGTDGDYARVLSAVPAANGYVTIKERDYATLCARDVLLPNFTLVKESESKFGLKDNNSIDGTKFIGTFETSGDTYTKERFSLRLGSDTIWYGLRIVLDERGWLKFTHINKSTNGRVDKFGEIDPAFFGLATFAGGSHDFSFAVDTFADNDTQVNYRVTAIIDGFKYKESFVYYGADISSVTGRSFGTYNYIKASVSISSPPGNIDFTIFGLNENWKEILGIK